MTTPPPWTAAPNHSHDNDDEHVKDNPADTGVVPQRKKLQLKPRSVRPADAALPSSSHPPTTTTTTSKSNPFGAAKPREDVLAAKGLDARMIDLRIEKKVQSKQHAFYTKEQEKQLEQVRAQVTQLESELRDANENELPEQAIIDQLEIKRKELLELTKQFDQVNQELAQQEQEQSSPPKQHNSKQPPNQQQEPQDAAGRPRFERPSQRRKRLEEQQPASTQQQQQHQHPKHQSSSHHNNNNHNHNSREQAPAPMPQHSRFNAQANDDNEAYNSFSTNRRRRSSGGIEK